MFQDLKDSKNDLPKIMQKQAMISQTYFSRIYLCYNDSRITKTYQDSTIVFPFLFQTIENDNCSGPTVKSFS